MDGDAGDALRRSLGLKPRSEPSSDEGGVVAAPATEAAPAATNGSSPASPPAKPLPARASDIGLGVRRRSGSAASAQATATEPAAPEPITDPAKKPVGKLPPDTQRLLRNYYMQRPEIDLPPFVLELPGSHGWYFGDGRPEREVVVGFTPAFVLYTMPVYPDGPPEWVKGEFLMPGLHEQPEYTERGFKVPERLNALNSMVTYIVWKSPGPLAKPPVEAAANAPDPDESPRDRRRREEMERRKRDLEERRARNQSRSRR